MKILRNNPYELQSLKQLDLVIMTERWPEVLSYSDACKGAVDEPKSIVQSQIYFYVNRIEFEYNCFQRTLAISL